MTRVIASLIAQGYNIYNMVLVSGFINEGVEDKANKGNGYALTPLGIINYISNYIKK